ncbi:MAG: ArsA-related P-loop ATPase [Elusimicrobiota bacterium]
MAETLEQIVVVGKGGMGKSMIASNLSVVFARQGERVLHVGCDPKHDSTRPLLPRKRIPTVADMIVRGLPFSDVLRVGIQGIRCIEAGGPAPGSGCAGRGITKMLELLQEFQVVRDHSVIMFDILGDVVCGGFAAPLRKGFGRKVIIVTSDEWMSLWAANNVARMVVEYAGNGVRLAGLVVNSRAGQTCNADRVRRFASEIKTTILEILPWDPRVEKAETARKPIVLFSADAPVTSLLLSLAAKIRKIDPKRCPMPRPMSDEQFDRFQETCRK